MLVLQDPTDERSTFLLESLTNALADAQSIVGAFSFASSAGVRLLTEDPKFQQIAENHHAELVIGVDAVTNISALDSLAGVSRTYPHVSIKVFLNPRRGSIFHPKFCWMRTRTGSILIAGSGNLTQGGLLRNWEAYSLQKLDRVGTQATEEKWNQWKAKHQTSLVGLDNPEARRLAAQNVILAREGDLPVLVAPPIAPIAPVRAANVEEDDAVPIADTAMVLVAEVPRSGNRWQQVNFHRHDYINFFGATGQHRLMIFRHVNQDGTLADFERARPPVTVRSRNFRFELSAGGDSEYPALNRGRPVGAYVRVAAGTFFYRIFLPDDAEYANVSRILVDHAGPPAVKMRSFTISVADLRHEWPTSPFWRLPATN